MLDTAFPVTVMARQSTIFTVVMLAACGMHSLDADIRTVL